MRYFEWGNFVLQGHSCIMWSLVRVMDAVTHRLLYYSEYVNEEYL